MSTRPITILAVAILMAIEFPKSVLGNPPPHASVWPGHKSGIQGQVSIQAGPPHATWFAPLQVSIAIFSQDGTHLTDVVSEEDGTFAVGLKRGTYVVVFPPIPAAPYVLFPSGGLISGTTKTVTVDHKEYTEASMIYFPGLVTN